MLKQRYLARERQRPRGVQCAAHRFIALIALVVVMCDAVAVSYSFDELRRGITESAAVARAKQEGWIVTPRPSSDAHFLLDARTNKVVGTLWICSGRLYGYSEEGLGGVEGFVKRVAQFNKVFDAAGRAVASSQMLSFVERNLIEVTWEEPHRLVHLELTLGGPKMTESQWVQYAVPSVCK